VLLALGAQILAIGCAVGISVAYIHRALWSSADALLQSRMVRLLALVGEDDNHPSRLEFDADQANVPPGDMYYIEDEQGHGIAGSPAWIGPVREHLRKREKPWNHRLNGRELRVAAMWNAAIFDQEDMRIPQLHATLFYAMPVDGTVTQIARASQVAVLVGLLSVLLSALMTWWAVGRGIEPLTGFARYADRIEVDRTEFSEPGNIARNSELIPLARALASLQERVQQAFQRERQFLSDAAHELKTAIAIQKSTLQLLEQRQLNENEYREGVSQALEDTGRIEHLVRNMLLLSSLEHERQSPRVRSSPIRIGDTIASAIEQISPVAQIRSVRCIFEDRCNAQIRGNESDLTLLWTNLIENAIRHSAPGAEVRIELGATESACTVRIVDRGSGISSVDLPHVFERFYRSDVSRSRSTGGFGLGLSIARAIVENLDGSIQISSAPGAGTTVEVTLPHSEVTIR
jgi:signal transduction histidine kinase